MKLLMRSFIFFSLFLAVAIGYAQSVFTLSNFCGYPPDFFNITASIPGTMPAIDFNNDGKAIVRYPNLKGVLILLNSA